MKHELTREERSRGGKSRKKHPNYIESCQKGFEVTMERHPYFARHYLKSKIKDQYPNGRVTNYYDD
jgi:hypothetical protein